MFSYRKKILRSYPPAFTLLEMLVALAIFSLLVIGIGIFEVGVLQYNRDLSNQIDANRQVQRFLVQIEREARTAAPSSLGGYPIESASATSLVYYANIDTDSAVERVRYFLNGKSIQRGVTKPTGSPLTYNIANEKISTAVDNVTNSDIFTYYDQNYDGTSAALAFPVSVTAIRLVKVRVVVDQQLNAAPGAYEGDASIEIRNLKAN